MRESSEVRWSWRGLGLLVMLLVMGCAGGQTTPRTAAQDAQAREERFETIYAMVADQLLLQQVRPASSELSRQDVKQMSRRLKYALYLIGTEDVETLQAELNLGQVFTAAIPLGWPGAAQLAEYFLQRVVETTPTSHRAFHLLGVLHMMTGDRDGALAYLERAASLDGGRDEPRIRLALGQLHYVMEEPGEAQVWLSRYLELVPEDKLVQAFARTVRAPGGDPPGLRFRLPESFRFAPYRPSETVTALRYPRLEYRNVHHGFTVSYPYTWTLYDEEVDYPLGPCHPMAELTLELPLGELDDGELLADRVRLLAFPVPETTTSESFSRERLPAYEYPEELRERDALIPGSVHMRYEEERDDVERTGEMVFYVDEGIAFFIHYMSIPETFAGNQPAFHEMLRSFRQHTPKVQSGCDEEPI